MKFIFTLLAEYCVFKAFSGCYVLFQLFSMSSNFYSKVRILIGASLLFAIKRRRRNSNACVIQSDKTWSFSIIIDNTQVHTTKQKWPSDRVRWKKFQQFLFFSWIFGKKHTYFNHFFKHVWGQGQRVFSSCLSPFPCASYWDTGDGTVGL